jgi:hypothetical protein
MGAFGLTERGLAITSAFPNCLTSGLGSLPVPRLVPVLHPRLINPAEQRENPGAGGRGPGQRTEPGQAGPDQIVGITNELIVWVIPLRRVFSSHFYPYGYNYAAAGAGVLTAPCSSPRRITRKGGGSQLICVTAIQELPIAFLRFSVSRLILLAKARRKPLIEQQLGHRL